MELYVYYKGEYSGKFLKFETQGQWSVWYVDLKHKIAYITDYGDVELVDYQEKAKRVLKEKENETISSNNCLEK